MNKKMREIYAAMQKKLADIKSLQTGDNKNAEAVAAALDELDKLQKAYDTEAAVYAAEKKMAGLGDPHTPTPTSEKSGLTGFGVIAKILRGQSLSEDEIKLVTPSDEIAKAMVSGAGATGGENSLIPEDVRVAINELRRTFVSLKDLGIVTHIPTQSLSGSFVFEAGTPTGLTNFTDGADVPAGGEPKFTPKKFAINLYGMIIPISNVLTLVEKAGLMAYLNKWFVKNAVITENTKILAALKAGKTAKALTGWADLKKSINVDLDPSCKLAGHIVTNQSGFAYLDAETDTTGRPILQPNPSKSTEKIFQDMVVTVIPDAQLANETDGSFPIFYGDTAGGVWFISLIDYLFATSEHAGFGKNQTQMRVIEGFDVIQADADAYLYGKIQKKATA